MEKLLMPQQSRQAHSSWPTGKTPFVPTDLAPRPQKFEKKMAQATRDWLIFRAHEIAIRTAANQPLEAAEHDAATGWSRIVDQHAYVECLNDIVDARRVYDSSYQRVSGLYANGAAIPWSQGQIMILKWSLWSLEFLSKALRRLRAEQRRVRAHDYQNTSKISIRWIADQEQRAAVRIDRLQEAILLVSHAAPQSEESSSSGEGGAGGGVEGGGDINANAPEVDNGVGQVKDPSNPGGNASQQLSEVSEPVWNGLRRNKRPQGGIVDGQPPQKLPRHSNDKSAGGRGEQLANEDEPLKAGFKARVDFATRWSEFLKDGKENLQRWTELHRVAERVFQLGGPPEYPSGTGDDAQEEFRVRVCNVLQSVIGRLWQSRINKFSEDGNSTHQGAGWKEALLLAREAAMVKALAGEAWCPPPESPLPYTAALAAEKFGFGGAELGIPGQWAYLLSLGRGGQGEAGLWMSVRSDGNNNVIDVSTPIIHRSVYRAPECSFMKPMDVTDTLCSAWWSKTVISRVSGKSLQYGSRTPSRTTKNSSENRLCTRWRAVTTKLVL